MSYSKVDTPSFDDSVHDDSNTEAPSAGASSLRSFIGTIDWKLVAGIWLISRLLIGLSFFLALYHTRANFHGAGGWLSPLSNWDGQWYEGIAANGYTIIPDSHGYTPVAFFPFYPSLIAILERIGLEPTLAGVSISNIAFFVTLAITYSWMERRFGKLAARWTMVVMAFQPYALFTGVVYTESLFMMLTVAALILFDRGLYPYAAVCGALASATRFVGVMLLPGMLFAWILQRRPASAAIAAIVSSTGAFAYIVFLHVHFGDALAFIHAENAWKANSRAAQTITHPPKFRSFLKAVMLGGACVLFVWSRKKFPTIFIAYAVAALLLILCSGQYFSADRYVYGIIVFSMALGLLFSHHRKWGYAAVFASVLVLCFFSASFAVGLFVG